jgi:hypothetical protein
MSDGSYMDEKAHVIEHPRRSPQMLLGNFGDTDSGRFWRGVPRKDSPYRSAVSQPLQKFDARIVKPICLVLGVDLSELISLEKPELILLKLDPVIQARITNLLDKGNQGTITKRERATPEDFDCWLGRL